MGKLTFILILLQMGIQSGMSYPDSIQENEPNYLYPKMDIFKHPMTKRQDYDLKQKN